MMGVTLNSIHSSTYDLVMLSKNRQLLPNLVDKYIEVPWRSGSYLQPGKFNDRLITVEFGVVANSLKDLRSQARQIAAWLYTKDRVPLIFDDEPGMTYMAKVEGAIDFENTLTRAGKFTVVVRCEPFAVGANRMKPVLVDAPIFTRTTVATMRDLSQVASGVVRYEAGYFQNLLTDNQASFETDVTNGIGPFGSATLTRNTTENYRGGACLKIVTSAASGDGAGLQNIPVKPNTQYTGSMYIDGVVGGEALYLQTNWYDANGTFISSSPWTNVDLTASWARYTHISTSPANAARVTFKVANRTAATMTFYVDACQFEGGSTVKDWILPSQGKAITVEQGTTNLWSNTNGRLSTMTAGGTSPPPAPTLDTTQNNPSGTECWKLTFPAGSATGYSACRVAGPNGAITAGLTYSSTVWVKGLPASAIQIYPTGSSGMAIYSETGRVVNGWKEYKSVGPQVVTTGNDAFTAFPTISPAADVVFYVAAGQLEQKNYPTSFISGTRNSENLDFKAEAGTISTDKGSIGGRFYMYDVDSSHYGVILTLFDTALNKEVFSIHRYSNAGFSQLFIVESDQTPSTNYGTVTNNLTINTWYDFVFTWSKENGRRLYLNGVLEKTNARNTPLVLGDKGRLGYNNGSSYLNGLIDDLFISKRELTAAEVMAFHNAIGPYLVDEDTTYALDFSGVLTPDIVTNAVNNSGTAPSLPITTVTFPRVGATDFKITHLETGKSVRVIYNFAVNDVLVIDHEKCLVTINGLRAMASLDLSSRFFELAPGTNTLVATTTGGGAYTKVDYKERWL